jgi:hypothetical protein
MFNITPFCSGTQAEFDVNLVTPIAFDSSEADRCFSQSCKMLGIAGMAAFSRSVLGNLTLVSVKTRI